MINVCFSLVFICIVFAVTAQNDNFEGEEAEGENLGNGSLPYVDYFARHYQSQKRKKNPRMHHSRHFNLSGSTHVGASCNLSSGLSSTCVTISQCPGAVQDLVKHHMRPVRCGFEGYEEVVCCRNLTDNFKYIPDEWYWGGEGPDTSGSTQGPITNNETPKPLEETNSPYKLSAVRISVGRKAGAACKLYGKNATPRLHYFIREGEPAQLGEFPHMVLLGYPDDGMTAHRQTKLQNGTGVVWRCGGTLISETFVLTAAHCVALLGNLRPFLVRVGDLDWSTDEDGAMPEDVAILNVTLHPKYVTNVPYHDIALVQLARPVVFTQVVQPACLPQPLVHRAHFYDGRPLIITGWGDSVFAMDKASPVLMKAYMTGVSVDECRQSYMNHPRLSRGVIKFGQMCARDLMGRSYACTGDSGGPLQVPLPEPLPLYRVVGVTSVGKFCAGKAPTLYARVADYVGWIESIVWP